MEIIWLIMYDARRFYLIRLVTAGSAKRTVLQEVIELQSE
jgi:hypothetical protein